MLLNLWLVLVVKMEIDHTFGSRLEFLHFSPLYNSLQLLIDMDLEFIDPFLSQKPVKIW